VLLGKTTDMIAQWGHDRLPTFGVGAERTKDFWRGVIRQLIARGALCVDSGEFASLSLVEDRARPILKGQEVVMLRADTIAGPRPRVRAQRQAAVLAATGTPEAAGLFEALRQWRSTEAKAQGVPPYVIFHDTTLRELAAVRPRSLDELGEVKGVGASKLTRYGAAVLAVVLAAQDS
jgi:ATP-dependent DNA helicase RecQ